jgi:hypothetical protein
MPHSDQHGSGLSNTRQTGQLCIGKKSHTHFLNWPDISNINKEKLSKTVLLWSDPVIHSIKIKNERYAHNSLPHCPHTSDENK